MLLRTYRRIISKRMIRIRKIRTRFLIALIVLSLLPLFLLGIISIHITENTLKENYTKTNNDHLLTSSEVADLLFRNIINLNRFIVQNERIRDDLRESVVNNSAERLDITNRTFNQLQRVINSNSFDTRHIDSICIFDLHFQSSCWGRSDDAGIYTKRESEIMQTDWYMKAVQAQGRIVFFDYNVLGDKANTFSTVKLFRDSAHVDGKPIGLLVFNVSKTMFHSIFNANQSGGHFMAMATSEDKASIVYPEGFGTAAGLQLGNTAEMLRSLEEQGYLINQTLNHTTQWRFVHLVQKEELLKESGKIETVTSWIAALFGLAAFAISYYVSGSITRPLLKLKKMMINWNKGAREFEETFKDDEVGTIGETFRRMAMENQELDARLYHSKLKEKEAELRALQAQIKPHFLYNTLDSIYLMARLKKTEEVSEMALALSQSFKISLNKGREIIPVFKELEHIKHYLKIQNIRYNGRFRIEMEIEESILGYEILKLILQPLVENAVYHGLEPKIGEGFIRIEGRKEGAELVFVVEDDGVGIQDLSSVEQGYGLRNVKERLVLYYGAASSFRVISPDQGGTRVEIRFKPYRKEEHAIAESRIV